MPSSTFTIAASGDDAQTGKSDAITATYPPATATGFENNVVTSYVFRDSATGDAQNYRIWNALLKWNTSSLPDNANVTGATLRVRLIEQQSMDGLLLTGDWGPLEFSTADYMEGYLTSAVAGFDYVALSGGYVDVPLVNAGTGVSVSGVTYLRLHISQRPADMAPTYLNYFAFATFDNTSGYTPPQLIVDYVVGTPVRLSPNILHSQTNLTGTVADIQDDPDAFDANWLTVS